MERTLSKELTNLKANVGLVVRGPVAVLRTFDTEVEALCARLGLKIAFKTASATKLWIKEGEPE